MSDIEKLNIKADKLVGIAAIAKFMGEPKSRVRYLVRINALAHYREGRIICASKQVLLQNHLKAARGQTNESEAA